MSSRDKYPLDTLYKHRRKNFLVRVIHYYPAMGLRQYATVRVRKIDKAHINPGPMVWTMQEESFKRLYKRVVNCLCVRANANYPGQRYIQVLKKFVTCGSCKGRGFVTVDID